MHRSFTVFVALTALIGALGGRSVKHCENLVTCLDVPDRAIAPLIPIGQAGSSGGWYTPFLDGQGSVFEYIPSSNLNFASMTALIWAPFVTAAATLRCSG
jgi:hypothetical protein